MPHLKVVDPPIDSTPKCDSCGYCLLGLESSESCDLVDRRGKSEFRYEIEGRILFFASATLLIGSVLAVASDLARTCAGVYLYSMIGVWEFLRIVDA